MIPIEEICRLFERRSLFVRETGNISYGDFADMVNGEAENLTLAQEKGIPAVKVRWEPASLARFIASLNALDVIVIGNEGLEGNLEEFFPYKPLLVLQTGGSTGSAKHVVHCLERFLSPMKIRERPSRRQLILYGPDHVAGIDAFLRLIYTGGSLIIPREKTPEAQARSIDELEAEVLAATPTQLRFLILGGSLEGLSLGSVRVITYGAEPMHARLREQLQELFPNAKLMQRFGMTELGALPVTMDPDDPESLILEKEGYSWKVLNDELHVRAPTRMLGTLEDGLLTGDHAWLATGDLAEQTERGAIRILGRRETLINVGGFKVIPEVVEALILSQPGVLAALVRGVPNPLTGQAVEARMVHEGNPDLVEFLRSLRHEAHEKGLNLAYVPTKIQLVDHLELAASGKLIRGQV